MSNLKKAIIKKKKGKIINLISPNLLIKHIPTKIEYTIQKIVFDDGKPLIIAYRYYSKPQSQKKIYITIKMSEFKNYEPV